MAHRKASERQQALDGIRRLTLLFPGLYCLDGGGSSSGHA